MVRRDPETGKFVSGSSRDNVDRWENLHGTVAVNIPAADLGGGTVAEQFDTPEAELINFSEVLDNDEVFNLELMQATVSAFASTTATAEGSLDVGYGITRDMFDAAPLFTRATHTANLPTTDFQQGTVDGAVAQNDNDGLLITGSLYAEPSVGDSTNGLGAGAGPANEVREFAPLRDMGRTIGFDQDDELYVIGELNVNNVSDHGVSFITTVDLHGHVLDEDC